MSDFNINEYLEVWDYESELNWKKATKLLELGANPDRIDNEVHLNIEQMLKYNVSPSRIIRRAKTDHERALVCIHLSELLENGLDPEDFVRSELQTVNSRSMYGKRFDILWWFDEKLELFTKYIKSKISFWDAYFTLVREIIFNAYIDQDLEDKSLLRIMKKPVKLGFIDIDDAVEYLHSVNEEYDIDEDDNPVPNSSRLLDRRYVRLELAR